MHIWPWTKIVLKVIGVGIFLLIFLNYKLQKEELTTFSSIGEIFGKLVLLCLAITFLIVIVENKKGMRSWSTIRVKSGLDKTKHLSGSAATYAKEHWKGALILTGIVLAIVLTWYSKDEEWGLVNRFRKKSTVTTQVQATSYLSEPKPVYSQDIVATRGKWTKRFEAPSWKSADFSAKPDGLIHVRITYLNGRKFTFLDGQPNDPRVPVGYKNLDDIWYVEYMSAEKHRDVNVRITYR